MELEFEKWHGNKNDFILMWFPHDEVAFDALKRAAPRLCQRDGSGIGADGILVLHTHTSRDLKPYKLSIINSDGSLAETCGNGIRCAANSILIKHRDASPKVELPDGIDFSLKSSQTSVRFLGILEERVSGKLPLVAVDMGKAKVNEENDDYAAVKSFISDASKELNIPELNRDWSLVSLGNRHLVFSLDKVSQELIRKIGPRLQVSSLWDGINVHIISQKPLLDADAKRAKGELGQSMGELFEAFVWERGAGETQACGSGACAVAVSQWASGLSDRTKWIGVDMPGGRLYLKQASHDESVTMAGPAETVFKGKVSL